MPAKAGIQGKRRNLGPWIPAFAGMTEWNAICRGATADSFRGTIICDPGPDGGMIRQGMRVQIEERRHG
jgi:hypothetical protein